MKIELDFRLLEASMELSTLDQHLALIEAQIERGQKEARSTMEAKTRELEPNDEAEWTFIVQEYHYQVDFVLPRALRNPFLVSLFAVYESTVTEIAKIMQKKKGVGISIEDLKGGFLKRSKKYYEHVLQFQLFLSNDSWQRLMLLSDLRNTIAHTNGRLDIARTKTRERILKSGGAREELGFLVVEGTFLKETFAFVKDDLESLVGRYKECDSANIA